MSQRECAAVVGGGGDGMFGNKNGRRLKLVRMSCYAHTLLRYGTDNNPESGIQISNFRYKLSCIFKETVHWLNDLLSFKEFL
uniref:Uncharacterized protein n=1 Tax=Angiostrongylus cantonensis TaxID=6313 RepID=A0A0K0CWS1_ANGCA